MHKIVFGKLLFLLIVPYMDCNLLTVRQTINGPVEGVEQTSSLNQKYYAFKGVPYAEPPITGRDPYTGEEVDRRFKAPEPIKRNWTEHLKVHNFKDVCIPSSRKKSKSSEDCLYLNIYVPAGGAERKTVLIWIHGGAFVEGESNDLVYGPDFLLYEDNIVVTVAYRLGIFGFLNLDFGEYTGNMGLKDQQLALRWIHENIENFSGNQDEILLFGESAGGASVNYHMLNKQSRKYFNRAFLISGTAFNYCVLSETNHMDRMKEFSNISNEEKLIEYLKTTNSDVLAKCHPLGIIGKTIISPWAATIENPETIGAFMTKTPDEIYTSDEAPVMDTMFSFNSQEYVSLYTDLMTNTEPLLKENVMISPLQLPFDNFIENTHPNEYEQALEKLRNTYYPDTSNIDAIKRGNIDLLSDLNMGYSVLKALVRQTEANHNGTDQTAHKNTFLFRLSINADLNYFKVKHQSEFNGTTHGDELGYIFHCHKWDQLKIYEKHLTHKQTESYDAIVRMVKLITNFARTGNPSIESDPSFVSCKSTSEIFCQRLPPILWNNCITIHGMKSR